MRSFVLGSAVVGLALAAPAPVPQDIDFDLAYALPNPTYTIASDATAQTVTYNPTAVFESAIPQITSTVAITATTSDDATVTTTDVPNKMVKRTACTSLPTGYGPVPSPDSASAFLADPDFASAASAAPTPSGYSQTFQNLQGSNNAYGYLGYTTLKTYDVNTCANKCNAINGCMAINIYFERDPTVDPGSGNSGCANPASTTNIKCVFWGGPVNTANAVNMGQWQNQFQVVIAGSNGYMNNSIVSPPGYNTAVDLGNAAINAPLDKYGYNTYMGSAIFNSGPFNASLCAEACSTKSAYALAHPPTDGSPVQTCQFFNTYILYINNTKNLQGQYCAMYSESWSSSYATNVGQYSGSDHFMIEYSYSYSNSTNAGTPNVNAAAHQASKDISYHSLQTYCSTLLGYTTPVTTVVSTTTTTPVTTATVSATTTITAVPKVKRDATSTSVSVPASLSSILVAPPYSSVVASALSSISASSNATATVAKRTLSTPAALTNYPGSVITSACSLEATAVTQTSTTTSVTTVTASASTTTVTAEATATATCSTFHLKISAPGAAQDGNFVQGPTDEYYYLGAGGPGYYASFSPVAFSFDSNTGYISSVASGTSIALTSPYQDPYMTLFSKPGYGYPLLPCSIDQTSGAVSCSRPNTELANEGVEAPTTWTQFYVGSDDTYYDGGYYQIFFGSKVGDLDGYQTVPATLTAVCI